MRNTKNYRSLITRCCLGLCLGISNIAMAKAPTAQQVISWITNSDQSYANPKNNIQILSTEKFRLVSGEEAYISSVEFGSSGRNFSNGYILTRPKLSQSQILEFGGQAYEFNIHTVDYKGKTYDLVEFESAGSGQGTIASSWDLTYFKAWQPIKIAEVESYSSPGRYSDELADLDCTTGSDITGILNVLPDSGYVLQTVVAADGCASKPQDYKIQSKLIPIVIK